MCTSRPIDLKFQLNLDSGLRGDKKMVLCSVFRGSKTLESNDRKIRYNFYGSDVG